MTMRLDYALYGIAIILFIMTGGIFVSVSEQTGGIIYGSLTAILGVISLGCAYFLKPVYQKKSTSQPQVTPTKTTIPEPEKQPTIAAETPKAEDMIEVIKPTEVAPKVETPLPKTSTMEHSIVIQPPQTIQMTKPETAKSPTEPETASNLEECAVDTAANGLAQIKCISAKRAEQLNANGIKTVEDLAKASSSELAAKLQVSEKIVKMWIGSAKKLVK
jgi:predicted flap endonuclease-1-like 5' DNA nuclease